MAIRLKTPMKSQQQRLAVAESYLRETVAPNATALDRDPEALHQALAGLGDRRLLALKVPEAWGGADPETARQFQEMVARYSGALAFLQTQHQSASGMLARSDNEALKQAYLPHLASGDRLLGVGFSQLRRRGTPMVKARPVADGFAIDGQVPWVTGWGLFSEFIVGAELPDGRALYGVVPFADTQDNGGSVTFSEPMQLAAMQSTQTVIGQLDRWFLPEARVVFVKPAGWIHESDRHNVLHHSFFALGCARAGLDIVESARKKKQLPAIAAAWAALDRELNTCRSAIYQRSTQNPAESTGDRQANHSPLTSLQLRAWAIALANRCAHSAVTVSSGAANLSHHPAQRVYREALVFSVSGQTTAVMEATLDRAIGAGEAEVAARSQYLT
jgi:alkylation response protein AidB-like acyl-CoA dehydrogenase